MEMKTIKRNSFQLYLPHRVQRGRGTWRSCRSTSVWPDSSQKNAYSAPSPWKRRSLLRRVTHVTVMMTERLARLGRTQSGRWSSWTSWCWGKTGSLWWWISAGAWSLSPATFAPRAHYEEGLPEGLTLAPPAGWEMALPSCWISVGFCDENWKTKKKKKGVGWRGENCSWSWSEFI